MNKTAQARFYLGFVDRFWEKAERSTSDCWNWQSTITGRGYGSVTIYSRPYLAHRIAYELANGAIPAGMQVCHSCDNPRCVNPAHLFLGTPSDNQQDSIRKGRKPLLTGKRNPMFGRFGEQSGRHKLREVQVREIRQRYSEGELQTALARRYNVSQVMISRIILRKAWPHI